MAQLTQKKSSNTTNKHQTHKQNNKLGKAPNDIYNLDNEIASIHSEHSHTNVDQKQSDQQPTDAKQNDQQEYKSFSTSNVSEAKQSLQNGTKIKVKLPSNPSPHALIGIANSLGFDTQPLHKLFTNSSIMVKNILDEYITTLKQKYSKINHNHPYQSSAFGYLYHCKHVNALQCEADLSAKIRINMDLNYNNIVLNDELFKTKFIYELSHKVFKCPSNTIRIVNVRAGSVIVVIAGITLITLASVGLFALSVKLHQRRQKQMLYKQGLINNNNNNVKANINNSPGCMSQSGSGVEHKQMDILNNKLPQPVVEVGKDKTFVSSIFSKIQTGINNFNEQYNTQNGYNKKIENMHKKLMDMGFKEGLVVIAVKKYPNNVNMAINWIMEHENDDNTMDTMDTMDKAPDVMDDNIGQPAKLSLFDSFKKSIIGNVTDDVVENNKENLMLNVNDPLWVNKKGYFWAATVIALSRDKVTIEYDNDGPYLWRKTETFALNDECLIQKQPGQMPEFEGCVEITKTNGGYIKAWKSGLNRPMADI